MKKVVILSAFATPFRSGAEACAEEIASRLNDSFDVTLITARLRRDLPHIDKLSSGVRVWRIGLGLPIDKWLYPLLAARIVRAMKPDVVHAILETFAGAALLRCKGPFKRILTMQTTNRSFLKGPIVRGADIVTAISTALIAQAEMLGRKDVTLIPNGIDLAAFDEAVKTHRKIPGRILFAGRLEPMKGVDTLIRAFATLNDPAAHLRIVGDGSQRRALIELARASGAGDRISFIGRVEASVMPAEFAQAPIFCGLSRSEALGNVFLEAQAAECAVIAATVGGIPDIVHDGETGLLVAPDDISATVNALRRLLDDSALRSNIAGSAREKVRAYDWDLLAKRYAALYA